LGLDRRQRLDGWLLDFDSRLLDLHRWLRGLDSRRRGDRNRC
jgi:hypothetical protein